MGYDFTRPMPTREYACIQVDRPKEGLKVITLNRPDAMNALSLELMDDLEHVFQELCFDNKTRVVILTGAGRAFCAGADLKFISDFTQSPDIKRDMWLWEKHMENIIMLMRKCPQPIISACNGATIGGGASLAMATDIRITTPKAKFALAYINVGLSAADMGSSYMIPRLIGVSRAAELMYTGRTITGKEAYDMGFYARCVEPEDLMATAMEYADILLGKSEMGLLLTKEALNAAMDGASLQTQVALENRNQYICNSMGSFSEGSKNFANKNK